LITLTYIPNTDTYYFPITNTYLSRTTLCELEDYMALAIICAYTRSNLAMHVVDKLRTIPSIHVITLT